MLKFSLVGASGIGVNMFFLWVLAERAGFPVLPASIIAIEFSILNNFAWNYQWTFRDRKSSEPQGWHPAILKYHLSVSVAALTNVLLLWLLHSLLGMHYLVANALGIVAGFALNYGISNR